MVVILIAQKLISVAKGKSVTQPDDSKECLKKIIKIVDLFCYKSCKEIGALI